jgi:histidinol-phosphate phosphatase family protein
VSARAPESRERPNQAVIVAGGRGTRMRPLTDSRPKPMVEVNGRPFLEYLVELLREQGFDRILLLLGYRADVIQEHFGDGGRWGVAIEYSVTAPDDLTASRVRMADERLDERFLFMYCDNFWPMRFDRMWTRYLELGAPAMVTVYTNKDGLSRDSVIVGEDDFVKVFDRSRTTPGLSGIEIGYAVLEHDVVLDLLPVREALPEGDLLFEEAVYPPLAERGELAAFRSDHRYYSVGSIERLPLTEAFLARRPAIILDRDGVLNKRPPRAEYVRGPEEFEWLPGAREALRLLSERDYRVIVVSNQAGVARGAMTASDVDRVNDRMRAESQAVGGRIDAVYYCPHDWDEGCECRKPRPGMLFDAARDFQLDLTRTVFVGDDGRDAEAAEAAGCGSVLVSADRPVLEVVRELVDGAS